MSGLATNSINVYAPLGQPQSSQRARRLLYYLFVFFVGAIYFAAEQFNFKSERNVFVAKQQAPKQLVILAWNMYRPELLKGISNLDDAMTRTSSNTGNLVWMYAGWFTICEGAFSRIVVARSKSHNIRIHVSAAPLIKIRQQPRASST